MEKRDLTGAILSADFRGVKATTRTGDDQEATTRRSVPES